MNVRDLIVNLLDYDMDNQVEIHIESKEDTVEVGEFDFVESTWGSNTTLELIVKLKDSNIIDASDFNDLKEEKEELANTVEDLRSKLEDAEQRIDELERESD